MIGNFQMKLPIQIIMNIILNEQLRNHNERKNFTNQIIICRNKIKFKRKMNQRQGSIALQELITENSMENQIRET